MTVTRDESDAIRREARLRAAVLAGDPYAWEVLYRQSCGPLHAYVAVRWRGPEDQIEEILQECWMIALKKIRSFDVRRGSFEAWLHGIARNQLRNRQRAASREARRREPAPADAPAPTPGPEGTQERIALAMTDLPARYQEVLRARYLQELSVREIASRWRCTPKAIESLLSRARTAFRMSYPRT
jgi:RNA polymerase sigma-70 factor (ECF subfamily)